MNNTEDDQEARQTIVMSYDQLDNIVLALLSEVDYDIYKEMKENEEEVEVLVEKLIFILEEKANIKVEVY